MTLPSECQFLSRPGCCLAVTCSCLREDPRPPRNLPNPCLAAPRLRRNFLGGGRGSPGAWLGIFRTGSGCARQSPVSCRASSSSSCTASMLSRISSAESCASRMAFPKIPPRQGRRYKYPARPVPASMEPVLSYLHKLLNAQRFGGRTVLRDEKTVIVYDTPSWGERESRAVRARFPDCDIAVHSNESSLSGFIVIVTRHREPWAFASESAFLLAAAALLWSSWWALGYLQRSSTAPAPI